MTVSSGAQDGQSTGSVYDILYYDARRIGSFLAQFDPSGHLQQVTQTESVGGHATSSTTKEAGVDAYITAKGGSTKEVTEEEKKESARVYDPLWSNAFVLLDYLDERKLLKKAAYQARIGQFVLVEGDISVFDLATVAKMWALPSIRRQITGGGQQPTKTKPGTTPASNPAEFGLEMISVLPHLLQVRIGQNGRNFWGSLREDSMVVSSSDLLLKHGASIAGKWLMLGILDAVPDDGASSTFAQDLGSRILSEGFTAIMGSLGPISRLLLGRSNDAFGITPLLIFRTVGE